MKYDVFQFLVNKLKIWNIYLILIYLCLYNDNVKNLKGQYLKAGT